MVNPAPVFMAFVIAAILQAQLEPAGEEAPPGLDGRHQGIHPIPSFLHGIVMCAQSAADVILDEPWSRSELGLVREQYEGLVRDVQGRFNAPDPRPILTRERRFLEVHRTASKLLSSKQEERFLQVSLFIEGPRALAFRRVADEVRLTTMQRDEIGEIVDRLELEHRQNVGAIFCAAVPSVSRILRWLRA